jgi:hypothetical protein
MKTKVVIRARELIVLRVEPFLWIYFNIGNHEGWKRVAFDFWFEIRGQTYGVSWEKEIRGWKRKDWICYSCSQDLMTEKQAERHSRINRNHLLVHLEE